jgi:excisionase family DNA binding protein
MTPQAEQRVRQAVDGLVAALIDALREQQQATPPDVERLLSIPEAAHLTGLGRSSVYELIARGELRSLKVGRRRLVPASAVHELAGRADGAAAGGARH